MSIHKFERPELDDEMVTATGYIVEAQGAMAHFFEQRSAVIKVREAIGRSITPAITAMLDEEIADCGVQAEAAEAATVQWREILRLLNQRSAKPF